MKKIILFGYVILGSIFTGIIAHEITHVIQFGNHVYSIGVLWGAYPLQLPLPAFYVQADTNLFPSMAYNELIAYSVQALTTLGTGLIGLYAMFKH
uniref:Uncharacterized protein n=1 Tax=viral metagenome TaxID=1070528 RepID=A0A6H1ZZ54_9ZZZZ